MLHRYMVLILLAAILLTVANAVVVGGYIYASAAVAEVMHASAVQDLAVDGLLPEAAWNQRLEKDGRSYRLSGGSGAVGLARDYLRPPRYHQLLTSAGVSVLLSLIAAVLLALATWSAARNRPAVGTRR